MSALQSIPSSAPTLAAGYRTGPLRPRRLREIGAHGECPGQSVLALLEEHAQHHPLNRALVMLDSGHTRAVTYVELAQRVKQLATRLSARFPEGGEPIAILSASSPAWGIVALATLASRNVLVPLDTSLEPEALTAVLERVNPAILFSSAGRYQDLYALAKAGAPTGELVCMDESHLEVPLPEAEPAAVGPSRLNAAPGTAVVAFTSGTTAAPKAVEISFDNLLFQIRALTACFALRPSDRLLSLLPMHHMLEFTAGFLCPLWCGAQVNYLRSLLPDDALSQMRALSITRVVTVPAWLALLKRTVERNARNDSGDLPKLSRLRSHARRAFGADFEHFVCGGAPLADEVAEFFDNLGAPVIQGYGLTETCPVVATNIISSRRRGSVGRPLTGTETGFSAAGEILVRGPHVAGRYRMDGDSRECIADDSGWFHTGDLGHQDSDGFLYITGRLKTTIVLASGKNVQPEEIETRLQTCDAVTEAGVVALGDARSVRGEEICLVAVPAGDAGNDSGPALEDRIREALAGLAAHKRPRKVLLRMQPLPRTASGKLLREELAQWAMTQLKARS